MTSITDPKRITYNRETRDYDAHYDMEYIGSYPNYHAAENALNDYVLDLYTHGVIDSLFVGPEGPDDPGIEPGELGDDAGDDEFTRCKNCGAAHFIQQCPEIWRALNAATALDAFQADLIATLPTADPDDGPGGEPWPDSPAAVNWTSAPVEV